MRKKKAPVSFATARATRVFPVPAGPYSRIPLGGCEKGKNIPSNAKRCHVKMETITIIGGWDDNLFLNCMCVCAWYLNSDSLKQSWVSKRKLHHFFDLGQLLPTTSNVIVANVIETLLFILSCTRKPDSLLLYVLIKRWGDEISLGISLHRQRSL